MSEDVNHGMIEALSGVSAFTGEGFVTLRWGAESGQLTPDEARQHALHILSCAEAAENDALTQAVLRETFGLHEQAAAQFLVEIRTRRPA